MTNTEINSRSDNNLGQNCNERLSIVIHIIQQLISSTSENCPKIVANLNGVNFYNHQSGINVVSFCICFWYFLHYTHAHFFSFVFSLLQQETTTQKTRQSEKGDAVERKEKLL